MDQIRRKRDAYLVPLTLTFGFHPRDVDRLTVDEFRTYCRWIDDSKPKGA